MDKFLSADAIHKELWNIHANYLGSGIKSLVSKGRKRRCIWWRTIRSSIKIAVSQVFQLSEIDMCITDNEISRSNGRESIRRKRSGNKMCIACKAFLKRKLEIKK